MRITASLICAVMLLASGQVLASQVTSVALHYQDGSTVARIDIKGPVRFTHQTEEAKDGKPFRVIVDVLSATHHLPAKDFSSLPKCPVQKIRTSQYSVKPEKVVRLVFDMEEETFYRVDSDNNSITLFFPDKERREFARWSSATYAAPSKAKAKAMADKPGQTKETASATQVAKSKKSVAEINEAIDEDRLLSLSGEPASTPTATEPAKKEPTPAVDKQELASLKKSKPESSPAIPEARQVPVVVIDVPYGPELDENLLAPPAPLVDASGAVKDQTDKTSTGDRRQSAVKASTRAIAETKEPPVAKQLSSAPAVQKELPEKGDTPSKSLVQKAAAPGKQIAPSKSDDKKSVVATEQKKAETSGPTMAKKPETKDSEPKTSPPAEKKPAVDKSVAATSQRIQRLRQQATKARKC